MTLSLSPSQGKSNSYRNSNKIKSEASVIMALFKGLKETKERKKAKSFYEQMPKLSGDPREVRKLRALISARLTGFIDMTFIEGAKDMENFQESGVAGTSPGGFSAAYKAVKTVGGIVVVYLPQKYTNFFYELGSKYQAANFTKNRVIALADDTSKEISQFLNWITKYQL